ncbi:CTLH/CRA C-terminal to lish motif domain-containing protein [Geranomyces variabilis]|nr:CTLH/CRA C-terminal to lish motif domain-containing protein [Geranomyces variabilis]KAJ3132427.1 hypothetical protein HDU90_006942 [Geranomyces variabilis]
MVASVLPTVNPPASTPHRPSLPQSSSQARAARATATAIATSTTPALAAADPLAEIYNLLPAPVPTPAIHRYIHDHLVHNCFPLTARAFAAAAHLHAPPPAAPPPHPSRPPQEEKEEKEEEEEEEEEDGQEHDYARKTVLDLVRAGDVAAAVEQCTAVFGGDALDGGSDGGEEIRFQCGCQMFVELVRISAPRAIVFAQQELFGKYTSAEHMATLNDIIGLIAYPDPAASPLASYLAEARRENLAARLNRRILESQGSAPTTMLERLVRQATVVRNMLQEMTELASKDAKKQPSKTQAQAQARWDVSLLLGERESARNMT